MNPDHMLTWFCTAMELRVSNQPSLCDNDELTDAVPKVGECFHLDPSRLELCHIHFSE